MSALLVVSNVMFTLLLLGTPTLCERSGLASAVGQSSCGKCCDVSEVRLAEFRTCHGTDSDAVAIWAIRVAVVSVVLGVESWAYTSLEPRHITQALCE